MANNPIFSRRRLLGASIETTPGTYVAPTVPMADTVIFNAKMAMDDIFAQGERTPDGLHLGTWDSIAGKKTAKLTFQQEIRPGDEFLPLLKAAGFVVSTGGVYTPTSDSASQKNYSFKLWEGGRAKAMTGCAASKCTIEGSGGGRVMANWEFGGVPVLTAGKWLADEAMPTPAAPINSACYVASGMTLTLGGSAIPHNSKFTIDLGLSTSEREDLTAETFVRHFLVDGWKRRISLDPEARLVAEFDSHGDYMTAATAALVLELVSGGSTLTISAPRVQRVGISEDARAGKMTEPIELQTNTSSGDDDLSFEEVTV